MSIRLRFLSGDVDYKTYGGRWISRKFNNGDWDYWYVVELINLCEILDDQTQPKYTFEILAVSPKAAKDHIQEAFISMGVTLQDVLSDEQLVDVLCSYGLSAPLCSINGDNFEELWKEVHTRLNIISSLFGFYMDKPVNRIGNTGWDFIKGNIGLK